MATALTIEMVTPDGHTYALENVERIVFRRREQEHEQGSEVAVFPGHGPMLVRVPCTPLRLVHSGETRYFVVAGGFAEVKGPRVLIVTPRFEEVGPDSDEVRTKASALAEQWLKEYEDFLGAMTGLETQMGRAARP